MPDRPVELDEHRGMAAQKSTELRRRLHAVQVDQTALQRRQDEFESYAVAAPSATWPEAAAKARYLIQLFAVTPEARRTRAGQQLIATVLDELARLSDKPGSSWRRSQPSQSDPFDLVLGEPLLRPVSHARPFPARAERPAQSNRSRLSRPSGRRRRSYPVNGRWTRASIREGGKLDGVRAGRIGRSDLLHGVRSD